MNLCPVCHRCPFANGVCEDRVNRGRRFFLMGALALPVARSIERVAPIVKPAYEPPRIIALGKQWWGIVDKQIVIEGAAVKTWFSVAV